jgi:undecaprenyl-diphosphatase
VLLNQVLKRIIRRPRPTGINLIKENGFSFPSGHSMVSMAFYGVLIYLINKSKLNKETKLLLSLLLSILILFIGISRIYLGVHYASDVLAGFSLSLAYLIISIYIYEKTGN